LHYGKFSRLTFELSKLNAQTGKKLSSLLYEMRKMREKMRKMRTRDRSRAEKFRVIHTHTQQTQRILAIMHGVKAGTN
jgi:hypothetical protein